MWRISVYNRLPHARLVVFHEANHMFFMEKAQEVAGENAGFLAANRR